MTISVLIDIFQSYFYLSLCNSLQEEVDRKGVYKKTSYHVKFGGDLRSTWLRPLDLQINSLCLHAPRVAKYLDS